MQSEILCESLRMNYYSALVKDGAEVFTWIELFTALHTTQMSRRMKVQIELIERESSFTPFFFRLLKRGISQCGNSRQNGEDNKTQD